MSSFWPCRTCETTNPTDVALCDVCGADRAVSAAAARPPRRTRGTAPPRPSAAGSAAPLRMLPLRLTDLTVPTAVARPRPAARPTPVRVDRRTTATPPTWKVQQAKIRRRVMLLLTSIRRAVREFLRA